MKKLITFLIFAVLFMIYVACTPQVSSTEALKQQAETNGWKLVGKINNSSVGDAYLFTKLIHTSEGLSYRVWWTISDHNITSALSTNPL